LALLALPLLDLRVIAGRLTAAFLGGRKRRAGQRGSRQEHRQKGAGRRARS
jgi:hypothetical protein